MPTISVLMPVRNAGPYLGDALASLWRQTLRDFEVIAVDDGSTDGSGEALERCARRERRLRVQRQEARGLPAALNAGLEEAQGELIARHDADDVSHAERFERQHDLLVTNPRVAVVGCRVGLLPRGFRGAGMRRWVGWHNRLGTHQAMAREALVDSPLAHGTAMIRRVVLANARGWRDRGWPEDVDLWLRLLEAGARFAKVPRVLYWWRQHAASATHTDPRYAQAAFDALRMDALERRLLRGCTAPTLIGVGASLERWRGVLTRAGYQPRWRAMGRPAAGAASGLVPPVLLVFGAAPARERWRSALRAQAWTEGADFAFIA